MNARAANLPLRRIAGALVLLLLSAAPALAEEVVRSFDSNVQLVKDGDLSHGDHQRHCGGSSAGATAGLTSAVPLSFGSSGFSRGGGGGGGGW